jgi:hypothetical protein
MESNTLDRVSRLPGEEDLSDRIAAIALLDPPLGAPEFEKAPGSVSRSEIAAAISKKKTAFETRRTPVNKPASDRASQGPSAGPQALSSAPGGGVSCPACGAAEQVPAQFLGRQIRCKACRYVFQAEASPQEAPSEGRELREVWRAKTQRDRLIATCVALGAAGSALLGGVGLKIGFANVFSDLLVGGLVGLVALALSATTWKLLGGDLKASAQLRQLGISRSPLAMLTGGALGLTVLSSAYLWSSDHSTAPEAKPAQAQAKVRKRTKRSSSRRAPAVQYDPAEGEEHTPWRARGGSRFDFDAAKRKAERDLRAQGWWKDSSGDWHSSNPAHERQLDRNRAALLRAGWRLTPSGWVAPGR